MWCLVILALFGAGYLLGVLWRSQPADGIGAWAEPFTPSPQLSDEYNQFAEWVWNEIVHMKQPWTPEIAERLAIVITDGYSEDYIENVATRPGATIGDQEQIWRFGDAEGVVAERLRRDEPISPEARAILVMAMLDSLHHPHWRIRHSAVQAVCYARLVEDRPVRLLVESMFNDPHPMVAANARKQLDYYDEIEAINAEGKP